MTTRATPLAAVRMTLDWSFLSSARVWASSLMIFFLGLCECFRDPPFLLSVLLHYVAPGSGMLTLQEAILIRVNDPSLNRNIGKYQLPHIWDEVLVKSPELKLN